MFQPLPRPARLDHQAEIDRLLFVLQEQAEVDLRPDLERTWGDVERAVLAHLAEEERRVLPLVAAHDPEAHRAIAREHDAVRRLLAEIAVGIEVHSVRLTTIQVLARTLRTRAARGARPLHPCAERQ
jgi:hypothetical protein